MSSLSQASAKCLMDRHDGNLDGIIDAIHGFQYCIRCDDDLQHLSNLPTIRHDSKAKFALAIGSQLEVLMCLSIDTEGLT